MISLNARPPQNFSDRCGLLKNQGRKFVDELDELRDEGLIDFVGVADISKERLKPVIFRNPQPAEVYTLNHAELIPISDAAIIATPNETHCPIALEWLRHGKHLLVEKPVATTEAEAVSLLELARVEKAFIMPGHMYRFSKLLRAMAKEVPNLGRIREVSFKWATPELQAAHGSLVFDLLPHVYDIFQMLFMGELPWHLKRFGSEKHLLLNDIWRGESDVFIELAHSQPVKRRSIEVVGDEASMHADVVAQPQFYFVREGRSSSTREVYVPPNNTLADEIRWFASQSAKPPEARDYSLFKAAVDGLRLINEVSRSP